MPRSAEIETLLWRVYQEASALLAELDEVGDVATGPLERGANYLAVLTAHIETLRRVVGGVEFHERADALISDLVASRLNEGG